jgi:hypothetical protein
LDRHLCLPLRRITPRFLVIFWILVEATVANGPAHCQRLL